MTRHPEEPAIQEYALTGLIDDPQQLQHLRGCAECQEKAAIYSQLCAGIKKQPVPALGFDLTAAVMQRLPVADRKKSNWLPVCYIFLPLLVMAALLYGQRAAVGTIVKGVSQVTACIIFLSIMAVMIFQLMDMVRNHRHQINMLK